jgi:hypothetical protein
MSRALFLTTSHVGFDVVFAVFVLAMLVLIFLVLRWAIRRDRVGRADWRERMKAKGESDAATDDGVTRR